MGRIVARLCAVYGWTPSYCLWSLSWDQVLMYHAYAIDLEMERRGVPIPRGRDDEDESPAAEGPDVGAIEARYGNRIKRGGVSGW